MAVVVSFLKRKGGVGATTLAVNLAAQFVAKGRRVRLLDCDSQHSATVWSKLGEGDGCLPWVVEPVDVPPSAVGRFAKVLERAKATSDVVLVDCAAGFPVTATEAVRYSDVVLVPCGPSVLDLEAAADAHKLAEGIRGDGERPVVRFVPARNLPRTKLGRELPEALARLGAPVLPGVALRIAVAESVTVGLTIDEYEPGGEAAKEFHELAEAVEALFA